MQHRIGLIGHPVSHSKSPSLFQGFFIEEVSDQWSYSLWDLPDIHELNNILQIPHLRGFNVTIPHKTTILPFLNYVASNAWDIQAVNTVITIPNSNRYFQELLKQLDRRNLSLVENTDPSYPLSPDKLLIGFNTDIFGFSQSLNLINKPIHQAVILGNGGSAKAVRFCLESREIPIEQYNRTPSSNPKVSEMEKLIQREPIPQTLWVNTTPLGMAPNIHAMPSLGSANIHATDSLIDLIYNPEETQLMRFFNTHGNTTINGWTMLNFQATQAWELFKIAAQ